MDCLDRFAGREAEMHTAYAPYRVCPLGAHIDHQKGIVTGFAIDKGVTLRFGVNDDPSVSLESVGFPGKVEFSLLNIPAKSGDWGDFAMASAYALRLQGYELHRGITGVIQGTLPVGGLSSSAAVILCYLKALMLANGIELDDEKLVSLSLVPEHEYIGLDNGMLDQACEVLCRKNSLLVLDTQSGLHSLIPVNPAMPDFSIMVVYSGVSRKLGSGYNMRVDEAKSASYCLKAFSSSKYGSFKDSVLRDVPYDVFLQYKDKLPDNFRKRAEHYYSEMDRVQSGIEAWKEGDIHRFGSLMFQSGRSSIENWETGSPELIEISRILENTDGVYGGRFSGAGFKGSCIALVDPAQKDSIRKAVAEAYLGKFPECSETFGIFFCKTSDGAWCR
ncbi:MAG: GHMP kinase [Candidatus Cloacimonetes bacterium]|nr:GHMP kinase [Candidatus Cloacimonadota bacterium]